MAREKIEGVVKQVAGKAQRAAGELLDDPEMEAKGGMRQVEGKLTEYYGDALDFVRKNPLTLLAAGVALALIANRLLKR
jgi:uncharacterized protein YjbJ (UPF0337 family)